MTEFTEVDGVDFATVTCNIGNPLPGPDATLRVYTVFIPQPSLLGNEDPVTVQFSATSVNDEAEGNTDNNAVDGEVQIQAAADIFLDDPG